LSYPIFWPKTFFLLVFWTHFTQLFSQVSTFYFTVFYNLFPGILLRIFQHLIVFIFQHCICSFCKHSVRLFLNFYPFKSHFFYQTFYLFVLQRFTFIFPFYSPLKTEKSRHFRRNFGREVTLKYLIWFRRDSSIILFLLLFLSFYYFINLFLILLFLFYLSFRIFKRKVTYDSSPFFLFLFLFC